MDNENKYNNALEKLQEALAPKNGREISGLTRGCIESIFPELVENEDEKIRKALIDFFSRGAENEQTNGVFDKDILAWVEKQESIDENKIIKRIKIDVATSLINYINANSKGMYLSDIECEDIEDAIINNKWYKVYNYMKKELEKQEEKPQGKSAIEAIKEKPVDNANKVEPKFHEGEWVVWDNKISCHIDNIYQVKESLMYAVTDTNNMIRTYSGKDFDRNAHLWTIQDAKDGDILYDGDNACIFKRAIEDDDAIWINVYCGINIDDEFVVNYENECWCISSDCSPATKEQRDALFIEMKKAGYIFDFDKKELKEIEPNSNWNEEDEKNLKRAIWYIENPALNVVKDTMLSEWLKSIKERIDYKKKLIDIIDKAAEWWLIHDSYSKDTNNLVNDFKKDLLKYVDTSK